MTAVQLYFEFKHSLFKFLLQALVLLVYIYLAISILPLWGVLICIMLIIAGYFYLAKQPAIKKIAHLDQQTWVLYTQNKQLIHAELQQVQALGSIIFLHFWAQNAHRKYTICVFRDQVSARKWQTLQQVLSFY